MFYTLSLLVLILYSSKKALCFSFKVTMFLHYLWVGPLQAIAVTALLWMETGISCLAGMSVLIFFSAFAKLLRDVVFITPVRETLV